MAFGPQPAARIGLPYDEHGMHATAVPFCHITHKTLRYERDHRTAPSQVFLHHYSVSERAIYALE